MRLAAFAVVKVICLWSCVFAGAPVDGFDISHPAEASVYEDGRLNMTGLVTKYGYPIETHTVQTKDGYILTMYRIPYGRECGPNGKKKVPVLLQHGLFCSSVDYLLMGPKVSLGYVLADRCYDVWMGNNRGNKESKRHVSLTPDQEDFWAFSWHHMGIYDLPAMIDHVLNVTGQPSLHYVGHSQGTTQFFVFASLLPEYHRKVRTMQALSPVVFMKHASSPILKVIKTFKNQILSIVNITRSFELFPSNSIVNHLGAEFCKNKYPKLQRFCYVMMSLLSGFDEPLLNKTMLSTIVSHTPAGAGVGSVIHYVQSQESGEFRQFDYGKKINLEIYKSKSPPRYPLEKIKIPMALYYGNNDFFASLKDIEKVSRLLPNKIEDYLVPYSKFNHMDFLYGIDVKHLLYHRVLESLGKY